MRRSLFIFILVIALVLSACNPAKPVANAVTPTESGNPSVTNTLAPAEAAQPSSTPGKSEPGKASLVGILIRKDTQPEKPYAELKVFLGILLIDSKGNTSLARVDPNNDPQTFTDTNGRFEFDDVKPGKYILAVMLPPNDLVKLKNPGNGQEMFITLEDGKVTDLGKLYYDFPFEPYVSSTTGPYPPAQPKVTPTPYP